VLKKSIYLLIIIAFIFFLFTGCRRGGDIALNFYHQPLNPFPVDDASEIPGEIVMSWDHDQGNYRYVFYSVYLDDYSGNRTKIIDGLSSKNFKVNRLKKGTRYYWCVSATYGYTETASNTVFSEEWSFETSGGSELYDLSAYISDYDAAQTQLHYNLQFSNLPSEAVRLVLNGCVENYTLSVSSGNAQIGDYVSDLSATTCSLLCYSDSRLLFDDRISLPQPLEICSVDPEFDSPLFSSYLVTVKVNYDAITSLADFTELDTGEFLDFRDLQNNDLDSIDVIYDAGNHMATVSFKIFVADNTTTYGTLKTNTVFNLNVELP